MAIIAGGNRSARSFHPKLSTDGWPIVFYHSNNAPDFFLFAFWPRKSHNMVKCIVRVNTALGIFFLGTGILKHEMFTKCMEEARKADFDHRSQHTIHFPQRPRSGACVDVVK